MSRPAYLWRMSIVPLRRGALLLVLALLMLFALANATSADAATVTVNSTGEEGIGAPDGQCTLNEAIYVANHSTVGYADCPLVGSGTLPNIVAFNIPTTPTQCNPICTIKPSVAYVIDGQVTIDGYTQSDASPNALAVGDNAVLRIELDGELTANVDALDIQGGTVTIRGLVINRYANDDAIHVEGGSGHQIVGNFIGTDASGSTALGNFAGIRLLAAGQSTTVGGTTPDTRNLISGNSQVNVTIAGTTGSIRIEGNYIGTNASGTGSLGTTIDELSISGAPNNTVGGTVPAAGNVISGSGRYGIYVSGVTATGNVIQGNLIGVDATGTVPLGNQSSGVRIEQASDTMVGGIGSGAGNTIAFNGATGPASGVTVTSGTGNAILGNRIFSNFGLGIDLGSDGLTPNDAGDGDTGANLLQNFPVLTAASVGAVTGVSATLNSTISSVFRIELFANPACDSSGNGEGQIFLGFTQVTTDGNGNAGFVTSLPAVPAGQAITATATNLATNNTSEFSACRTVQQAGFTVSPISGPTTEANEGTPFDSSFTVVLNSVPAADVTVALSVSNPAEGAIVGPTTLTFTPANATTPQTVRVIGVDDTLDDGNVAYAIVLAAATSNDPAYAGLKPPDVAVTNLDDDTGGTLQFVAATSTVAENAGAATITVSRAGGLASGVTVQFSTSNGTATAPADYTATAVTVTFGAGETTKTVTIPITNDTIHEADETILLTLSNPGGGATLGSPNAAVLTIIDDDPLGPCSPRPNVVTHVVPTGDGRLRVTLLAASNPGSTNTLQAITWGSEANATVDVVGGGPASAGQRTPLPTGTASVTFLVSRVVAGQATTVTLTATDACGDFHTFVGGGPHAF